MHQLFNVTKDEQEMARPVTLALLSVGLFQSDRRACEGARWHKMTNEPREKDHQRSACC